MAICTNDNRTRGDIPTLRDHLVTDALLQNGQSLLTSKVACLPMQGRSCNRCRRDNVIEYDMRTLFIEHAPPILLCQLTESLDSQWCRRIVAHHMVNIHNNR